MDNSLYLSLQLHTNIIITIVKKVTSNIIIFTG